MPAEQKTALRVAPGSGKAGAIRKILLPIDPAVPYRPLLRQAGWLARQCGAELVLLRAGASAWDIDDSMSEAVAVTRLQAAGDPVHQIVTAAKDADLIMMATHPKWRLGDSPRDERDFLAFLRLSVVARVIERSPCAVWVDASPTSEAVRKPLCYLDLKARSIETLVRAAAFAAALDAPLTVGHATFRTEIYAPGGASLSAGLWKQSLAETATEIFARMQRDAGTAAELVIENGEPQDVLPRLAARTGADLLMTGHWDQSERWARGGRWNDESDVFRRIRHSRIPVLVFKMSRQVAPPKSPLR